MPSASTPGEPIFVAASHQSGLDTRSMVQGSIKVGMRGEGGRVRDKAWAMVSMMHLAHPRPGALRPQVYLCRTGPTSGSKPLTVEKPCLYIERIWHVTGLHESKVLLYKTSVVIKTFINLEYPHYFHQDNFCKTGTVSIVNRWVVFPADIANQGYEWFHHFRSYASHGALCGVTTGHITCGYFVRDYHIRFRLFALSNPSVPMLCLKDPRRGVDTIQPDLLTVR